jgi:hypothetical protein
LRDARWNFNVKMRKKRRSEIEANSGILKQIPLASHFFGLFDGDKKGGRRNIKINEAF